MPACLHACMLVHQKLTEQIAVTFELSPPRMPACLHACMPSDSRQRGKIAATALMTSPVTLRRAEKRFVATGELEEPTQ